MSKRNNIIYSSRLAEKIRQKELNSKYCVEGTGIKLKNNIIKCANDAYKASLYTNNTLYFIDRYCDSIDDLPIMRDIFREVKTLDYITELQRDTILLALEDKARLIKESSSVDLL
jgi:hypothetical protein